jgi:release factor glutamine methyltransferase
MKMIDKNLSDMLKNAGIENYIFESRIIAEHAEKTNSDIYVLAERRIKREPLQYLIGEWEFYGDVYKLNADCLIPRPETEFLTEYIISRAEKNVLIWDLCSGSGCVSISALKRRKDLRAALIEISPGALEMSKENAEINGVFERIDFHCLDIINDFEKIERIAQTAKPNLIASNPPYLTSQEAEQIKAGRFELSYEPEQAFRGGEDGLDFYRFITAQYRRICGEIVFECGINQYKEITAMFAENGFECEVIKDYAKIERIIAGKKI